jgi:transposase InsO family protein
MSEHDYTSTSLTVERLKELLHYDPETGIFTWKVSTSKRVKVGDQAGKATNLAGYKRVRVLNELYLAHRLAWFYVFGSWPTKNLDHINRVKTDNRIANLREADHTANSHNMLTPKRNTSGHVGVWYEEKGRRWIAGIMHQYKRIHLGRFCSMEDAIAARKAGELRYWGHHRDA